MWTTVSLKDLHTINPGDYFTCLDLKGTVVRLIPHQSGLSYSVWLDNPFKSWMNNFEWILYVEPLIERGRHV